MVSSLSNENERQNERPAKGPIGERPRFFGSYESILKLRTTMFTDKEKIVRSGITKADLSDIKDILGLDYSILSAILGLHERSLYIKKNDDAFNKTVSDKIMSIAELFSYGYNIFKSQDHFHRWMHRKNRSLDRVPIDMLDTNVGMEEVRNEIIRREYGIF